MNQDRIVNRNQEMRELKDLSKSGEPSLGLLYGRRRVGKTFLLRNTWKKSDFFYFLFADETAEQNRKELLHELKQTHLPDLHIEDYPNWRTIFRLLLSISEDNPLVVILDEFQHLMSDSREEETPSKLSAVWEETENIPITLLLCGSEISMMRSLNEGKGAPLYGRFDWAHRIEPFTYLEASEMMGDRSSREKIKTFAIYGGIPSYLDAIPKGASLKEHVIENILSPRGPVHLQIESLFQQEKGIRDAGAYHSILTAIASGNTTVNEIAQASGITGEGNVNARDKLKTLRALFLVDREKNRDSKKGPYRYYIKDHGVNFWYRFVRPHRSRLELEAYETIWNEIIQPSLNTYTGQVFEHICRQSYDHFCSHWNLPPAERWDRWQAKDKNRNQIEIDIVSDLVDGSILTGEIKWSSQPIDPKIHYDLVKDLENLSNSGRGWAERALDEKQSSGHIYFSAGGFTDSFQELAHQNSQIKLIELDDLF